MAVCTKQITLVCFLHLSSQRASATDNPATDLRARTVMKLQYIPAIITAILARPAQVLDQRKPISACLGGALGEDLVTPSAVGLTRTFAHLLRIFLFPFT